LLAYFYVDLEVTNTNHWLLVYDVESVTFLSDGAIEIRMNDGKERVSKAFFDVIPLSTLMGDLNVSADTIRTIKIGDLSKAANRANVIDMGVKKVNIRRTRPLCKTKWMFIAFRLSVMAEDSVVYQLLSSHSAELESLSRQAIGRYEEEEWLKLMSLESLKEEILAEVRRLLIKHGTSSQLLNSKIEVSLSLFQKQ